jgi:hypothetical protein
MSAPDVRLCKCGKPAIPYDLGMFGPSGMCSECYNVWYTANYYPPRPTQHEPTCGRCGAVFRTSYEAAEHEGHAHLTEQRIEVEANGK